MVRYTLALLLVLTSAAVVSAGGKGLLDVKVAGKLTDADPKDPGRGAPSKAHVVRLKAGQVYTIDLVSSQFDAFLRLQDNKGKQLAEDDDSGGGLNARIIFKCPRDGEYRVICTSFNAQGRGAYVLTVRATGKVAETVAAHDSLLRKAAPDFQGDFAVNGPPVKLSDLKGRVVLLAFWDVRSPACAVTVPRLQDWHKAFAPRGLEILAVTFRPSEIGQKVGFDPEAGKFTNPGKAGKESDEAMLKDFAAYHKIGHRLMTLPLSAALKTFNAYAVNGVPQFVLVDRAGQVRLIRVGETAQGLAALEGEIKKLLAGE